MSRFPSVIDGPGLGKYNWQPMGSLDRSGESLVYRSNNGRTEIPGYCETWLLSTDLPVPSPITNVPENLREIGFTEASEGKVWWERKECRKGVITVRVFDEVEKG